MDELPAIWRQKYKEYLGLDITDDNDGILQDVHWAYGSFGYFPAYAMASMNAAQLEAAMRRDHPDLDQRFASGDFSIPAIWMQEHVYKYGAIYDTPKLMRKATGNETAAYDFLNYLDDKYEKIIPSQLNPAIIEACGLQHSGPASRSYLELVAYCSSSHLGP